MIELPLALALLAAAQDPSREFHCDDPQNQQEMNTCARIEFERADGELNALWRDVIAGAREADRELDRGFDDRPGSEEVLRQAQRAWITYRDAHCTWQGYEEARGGTMEPLVYNSCRASVTRERIAQLRPQDEQ
jgi:uncharacterized protein YecT (DUF1311 family)